MQFDETSKVIFLEELKKNEKKAIYFFIKNDGVSSTLNVDLTDDGEVEDVDGVPVVYGENAKAALASAKFVVTEQGLSLIDLNAANHGGCSCGSEDEGDGCSCGDGGCGCH